MKVLLLFHHLRHPNERGGQRSREVAEALSARGHDVTVLVPNVDPLTDREGVPALRTPWKERSESELYKEVRYWVPKTARLGLMGRFFYSGVGLLVSFVYVALHARKYQLLAVTSHPLPIAYAVFPALLLSSAKLVVEVRDIPADVGAERGVISKSGIFYRTYKILERFLLCRASLVISYSGKMLEFLSLPPSKTVEVLPIGAQSLGVLNSGEKSGDHLDICFFGTLGNVLDLGPVFLLLRKLNDSGVPARLSVYGEGEKEAELRKYVNDNALPVVFKGVVVREHVPAACSAYDFAIYPVQGGGAVSASLGNKFFDYLSARVPILVIGSDSEAGLLVERYGLGLVSDGAEDLARKIMEMIEEVSGNTAVLNSRFSLVEALEEFSKDTLLDKWCTSVEDIL